LAFPDFATTAILSTRASFPISWPPAETRASPDLPVLLLLRGCVPVRKRFRKPICRRSICLDYFGLRSKCKSVISITNSRDVGHLPYRSQGRRCAWAKRQVQPA